MDLRKTLWFEYQIFNKWMRNKVYKIASDGDIPDFKHLFKIALHELKEEGSNISNVFVFIISKPISEVVCKTWESINDVILKQFKDGTDGQGTNKKMV